MVNDYKNSSGKPCGTIVKNIFYQRLRSRDHLPGTDHWRTFLKTLVTGLLGWPMSGSIAEAIEEDEELVEVMLTSLVQKYTSLNSLKIVKSVLSLESCGKWQTIFVLCYTGNVINHHHQFSFIIILHHHPPSSLISSSCFTISTISSSASSF